MESNELQIEELIESFNSAWLQGDFNKLSDLLHDQVIFVSPDRKHMINGRENCLLTLKEYVASAKTHSFEIKDKEINHWDNTATAVFIYSVEYEMNDRVFRESGKEIWVLLRLEGKWKLAWRSLIFNKSA